MIQEVITQWEQNKDLLQSYFRNNNQSEYSTYKDIVKAIFKLVVTRFTDYNNVDYDKIKVIDDGDYQGTQLFIVPSTTYQPDIEDYFITHNSYGSCSGCDTLQGISNYDEGLPSDEQIKEYMTLSLHLVQKIKKLV